MVVVFGCVVVVVVVFGCVVVVVVVFGCGVVMVVVFGCGGVRCARCHPRLCGGVVVVFGCVVRGGGVVVFGCGGVVVVVFGCVVRGGVVVVFGFGWGRCPRCHPPLLSPCCPLIVPPSRAAARYAKHRNVDRAWLSLTRAALTRRPPRANITKYRRRGPDSASENPPRQRKPTMMFSIGRRRSFVRGSAVAQSVLARPRV
jgi:hypothetical protein